MALVRNKNDRAKPAILLLLGLIFVPCAFADPLTFEWDAPTQFVNGSPLDPSKDLSKYKFYKDGVFRSSILAPGVGTPPPTTYKLSDVLTVGTHKFHVTAVGKDNQESLPSNVLDVVVTPTPTATPTPTRTPGPKPEAPTGFRRP